MTYHNAVKYVKNAPNLTPKTAKVVRLGHFDFAQ